MTEHEYPLWCIDRHSNDEVGYLGPFDTAEEAQARCNAEDTEDPTKWSIRRCRRVTAKEIGVLHRLERLVEEWDEGVCDSAVPSDCWANWEDSIVELRATKDAEGAFLEWAEKHLRIDAYVCEPEEDRSALKEGP
jgi:hypothetical protein